MKKRAIHHDAQRAHHRPGIRSALALAFIVITGCSARPVMNEMLSESTIVHSDLLGQAAADERDPELLVLLALSGGGTRAAALAYGVLQELADTRI